MAYRKMAEKEIIRFVIDHFRKQIGELDKKWKGDMPDIIQSRYLQYRFAKEWAEGKLEQCETDGTELPGLVGNQK
jgi:hypothetical protein